MTTFHISFEKDRTIDGILDDLMRDCGDIGCQVSEVLELFQHEFLIIPDESLWMSYDTKITAPTKITLLVYDVWIFQNASKYFADDSWENRDTLIDFTNNNGGVALTVFVSLCRATQMRLMKNDVDVLTANSKKAKEDLVKLQSKGEFTICIVPGSQPPLNKMMIPFGWW